MTKMKVALMTAIMTALASVNAFASTSYSALDLSGVDFAPITDGIQSVIPVVIPVVVVLLGWRKGISFLRSMLKGA